jgi:hypothetical protein
MNNTTRQANLFDDVSPQPVGPSPDVIRKRLDALLATARAAERIPWDPQRANVNAILFRQMANWLPEDERDSMCAAFARELERLRAAG